MSDNGSNDSSINIAKKNGARVITISKKGYGNAIINGINNAKGEFIIMGDADMSYDFNEIGNFLKYLEQGYDLVVGNRFKGGIDKGAMPISHYFGVPFLSIIGNLLFKTPIKDFHCGLRGFSKKKVRSLHLESQGMELASEMICKASIKSFKMKEIPIKLHKDQRERKSHLRTIRDGFRHLSYMIKLKIKSR